MKLYYFIVTLLFGYSSISYSASTILSPSPPASIPIRVFDPQSGLIEQQPLNSDWWAVVRWQGPYNRTFKQIAPNWYSSAFVTKSSPCKNDCELPYRNVIGGGPHNVVSYSRVANPQPVDRGLRLFWSQSVDEFDFTGGVGQLSAFLYLRHLDGTTWALVINTWDNRPERRNYSPYVGNDTYNWFVSIPITTSEYISSNRRHEYQSVPWQEYMVVILPQQFQRMFDLLENRGINVPSRNLEEYGVIDAGIIHEIFLLGDPDARFKSYTTFTTIQVETLW